METKYDYTLFGQRLAERRNAKGYTQLQLGLLIWPLEKTDNDSVDTASCDNIRKKINSYEKKNVNPPLDVLCKLCTALDCSLDYLLGAIDMPYHNITDIHNETGLSCKAIQRLTQWKKDAESTSSFYVDITGALNRIIESASIEHLLDECVSYQDFCVFKNKHPELLTKYFQEVKMEEYNKAMDVYGSSEESVIKSFIHLEMFSIAHKGLEKSIKERVMQEFESVLQQIGNTVEKEE